MRTRVLTAHIPVALAKEIDGLADRLERSRGWIVQKALIDWLEKAERQRQMTLEALADVDADRVLDHDVVRDWIDGLGTRKKPKKR